MNLNHPVCLEHAFELPLAHYWHEHLRTIICIGNYIRGEKDTQVSVGRFWRESQGEIYHLHLQSLRIRPRLGRMEDLLKFVKERTQCLGGMFLFFSCDGHEGTPFRSISVLPCHGLPCKLMIDD